MRVAAFPESTHDIPPPPYTPHDSTSTEGTAPLWTNVAAQPFQPSLRGGYMRPSDVPIEEPNFPSAAPYFEERQPSFPNRGQDLNSIEHNIKFTPDTTRDDLFFPTPTEIYVDRDVTGLDWSTFVNYLFPGLDHSASKKVGNEKGFTPRAFMEEDTPERRQRIEHVVAEWNQRFFGPRLVHINAEFAPATSQSIPVNAASNNNGPVSVSHKGYPPATLYRSHSFSSASSSSSSSSSSVDSIKSKDLDGADIHSLRSALLAFHLDRDKKNHLRQSVRQLRDEFRSQRRDLPRGGRKELRKEYKDQRKELKREVKAVIKEVKATSKAERKLRKAERKNRRHCKRAETRGMDRISCAQDRAQRKLGRAEDKARRAQVRAEGCSHARKARARNASDSASSCERGVADAQPRTWDNKTATRDRAQEIEERARATTRDAQARHYGDVGRENAKLVEQRAQEDAAFAVQRAQETARTYTNRHYEADSVARAQETAQNYWPGPYGADANIRAQEAARNAGTCGKGG